MIPPCRNNEPPPPYQDKDREKVNTFDKRFVKPHFLYNSVQKRPLIEQAKERIPLQWNFFKIFLPFTKYS